MVMLPAPSIWNSPDTSSCPKTTMFSRSPGLRRYCASVAAPAVAAAFCACAPAAPSQAPASQMAAATTRSAAALRSKPSLPPLERAREAGHHRVVAVAFAVHMRVALAERVVEAGLEIGIDEVGQPRAQRADIVVAADAVEVLLMQRA